MNITGEDKLVSFEIAKLAKKAGFNETIGTWYYDTLNSIPYIEVAGRSNISDEFMNNERLANIANEDEEYVSTPTQTMLARWLMKEHDCLISIIPDIRSHNNVNYIAYKGIVYSRHCGFTQFNFSDDDYDVVMEEAFKYVFNLIK